MTYLSRSLLWLKPEKLGLERLSEINTKHNSWSVFVLECNCFTKVALASAVFKWTQCRRGG